MGEFEDRQRAFERKFELDEQVKFKIASYMSRLFGKWAAVQMGLTGEEAAQYELDCVSADLEKAGHDDLMDKVEIDFKAKGLEISRHRMQKEIEACYSEAQKKIVGQI